MIKSSPAAPAASSGLSGDEAATRLRRDGPNAIVEPGRRAVLAILLAQFASPLVLLLLAASAISIVAGEQVGAGVILVIVALSGALGFVQEARSEAAVAALRARLALQATVIRDGVEQEVPARTLVVGDLIVLRAGDIVPADGRLVEANHLYVDESAMTGEAEAATKEARPGPLDPRLEADRSAHVYFGTSVVSGQASATLIATGRRTTYGLVAQRLAERPPENDFQRGVRRFGFLIARLTLLLVVGVFAVDVGLHRPLLESLLFAIALAVGLTPELLPAIVTVNLSRGARALAARGVLVKHLPAIQNLGSMTVLCTDKTGTLTEGHLTLERAVHADGTAASEVLDLAWLNSHFETGFANPLDLAILAQGQAPPDLDRIRKSGELPFDFRRRCLSIAIARDDGRHQLIVKGAPEAILSRSTLLREAEATVPLDRAARARVSTFIEATAAQAYRAVAVGTRTEAAPLAATAAATAAQGDRAVAVSPLESAEENGLVFEGLLLFRDPPKADIGGTVSDLASLGIGLKILTGDHEAVAQAVAEAAGLVVEGVITGTELATLGFPALVARARRTTTFARLDPDQKLRVIRALQEDRAIVGYLGDGINDAPALHVADVGISVDNATDVARSAADLILLQPSLAAIAQGVREGRRTFANTLKYIRMGTSSNFGNMLSMAGAALVLPFLPMLPSQILINNLIYDASQTAIPSDGIDPESEAQPASWDIGGIERFMIVFGPLSSIFDYLTFGLLLLVLGADESAFHTGWFIESLATQTLVIMAIRTQRVPFWRSAPSRPLVLSAAAAVAVGILLPLSPLGPALGFVPLPLAYWLALPGLVAAYLTIVELAKRWFWRRPGAGKLAPISSASPARAPGDAES